MIDMLSFTAVDSDTSQYVFKDGTQVPSDFRFTKFTFPNIEAGGLPFEIIVPFRGDQHRPDAVRYAVKQAEIEVLRLQPA